ncbi:Chaperone 2 [Fusarium albosuccineum]|uniref:Chaperone 2 n=1 Tax=Fusarium albosuccineum TaxID=1237068 RepID=A0A8H4KRC1_9HYPO|nr:Chaperone 2 [Fusarium albosuccineum]
MPLRPPSLRRLRSAPIPPREPCILAGAAWSLLRCRAGAAGLAVRAQQRRWRHEEVARKNHYERLNLRHDATPAEIKKSFYSLSKTHHPDANPKDPNAAQTFSLLSESYTVLSNTDRRATYDRDVLRLHHTPHHGHGHHNPRASYHSTNPAGGRSPSGLSRRRGTFRGPPPSFYRSGGWGNQGEKRRQAHEESTGFGGGSSGGGHAGESQGHGASSSAHHHQSPWGNPFGHHQSSHGGMGPGDDPFGHHQEVPHFDKAGHTRTHRREDQRRKDRQRRAMGDDDIEFEPQTSIMGHFFIISGILAATILAPLVYVQFMRLGRQRRDRD